MEHSGYRRGATENEREGRREENKLRDEGRGREMPDNELGEKTGERNK